MNPAQVDEPRVEAFFLEPLVQESFDRLNYTV